MCLKEGKNLHFRSFYGMFECHLQMMQYFHDRYSFFKKRICVVKHFQKPRIYKNGEHLLYLIQTKNYLDLFSIFNQHLDINKNNKTQ